MSIEDEMKEFMSKRLGIPVEEVELPPLPGEVNGLQTEDDIDLDGIKDNISNEVAKKLDIDESYINIEVLIEDDNDRRMLRCKLNGYELAVSFSVTQALEIQKIHNVKITEQIKDAMSYEVLAELDNNKALRDDITNGMIGKKLDELDV